MKLSTVAPVCLAIVVLIGCSADTMRQPMERDAADATGTPSDRTEEDPAAPKITETEIIEIALDALGVTEPSQVEVLVSKRPRGVYFVQVRALPHVPGAITYLHVSPDGTVLDIQPGL